MNWYLWMVLRFASFAALLMAGLMADWQWSWCAFAWLFTAFGLLFWSICENEMKS